jgi:hypothetical protein
MPTLSKQFWTESSIAFRARCHTPREGVSVTDGASKT